MTIDLSYHTYNASTRIGTDFDHIDTAKQGQGLSHIHDDRNFIDRMLFLSIPQRVTSYPNYPSYTDIILTLL